MSEVDIFSKQLDIRSPGCLQVELENHKDQQSMVGFRYKKVYLLKTKVMWPHIKCWQSLGV